MAGELAGHRREFAHRDYHTRNLLLDGERLRIIDFQDALMASEGYDLASLLRDAYVSVTQDEFGMLVELFLVERAKRGLVTLPAKEFRRLVILQGLQRNLKVLGRFHYIDIVKKNPNFLGYLPRVAQYASWAFAELPEYSDLRKTVVQFYPEVG